LSVGRIQIQNIRRLCIVVATQETDGDCVTIKAKSVLASHIFAPGAALIHRATRTDEEMVANVRKALYQMTRLNSADFYAWCSPCRIEPVGMVHHNPAPENGAWCLYRGSGPPECTGYKALDARGKGVIAQRAKILLQAGSFRIAPGDGNLGASA
jgi:hypothetical protein